MWDGEEPWRAGIIAAMVDEKILVSLGVLSLNKFRSRQVITTFTSSLLYCYKQLLNLCCASTEKQHSNHGTVG